MRALGIVLAAVLLAGCAASPDPAPAADTPAADTPAGGPREPRPLECNTTTVYPNGLRITVKCVPVDWIEA